MGEQRRQENAKKENAATDDDYLLADEDFEMDKGDADYDIELDVPADATGSVPVLVQREDGTMALVVLTIEEQRRRSSIKIQAAIRGKIARRASLDLKMKTKGQLGAAADATDLNASENYDDDADFEDEGMLPEATTGDVNKDEGNEYDDDGEFEDEDDEPKDQTDATAPEGDGANNEEYDEDFVDDAEETKEDENDEYGEEDFDD